MSKRIVQYFSDLIVAEGPVDLDELTDRIAAAGLTKARNPLPVVRSALSQSPAVIRLPDGRFDCARRLLDGAVLTHRVRFATAGRQVLYAGAELAPFSQLAESEGSLRLATGGALGTTRGELEGWVGPPGWLPPVPADSLLAIRMQAGTVRIEPAPEVVADDRVRQLRALVARHTARSEDRFVGAPLPAMLLRSLLAALAEVPDLLAEPIPPLDEILHLRGHHWTKDWVVDPVDPGQRGVTLTLEDVPPGLEHTLRRRAGLLGVTPDELGVLWLAASSYRTEGPCRHDIADTWTRRADDYQRYGDRGPDPSYGDVVPLQAVPQPDPADEDW